MRFVVKRVGRVGADEIGIDEEEPPCAGAERGTLMFIQKVRKGSQSARWLEDWLTYGANHREELDDTGRPFYVREKTTTAWFLEITDFDMLLKLTDAHSEIALSRSLWDTSLREIAIYERSREELSKRHQGEG